MVGQVKNTLCKTIKKSKLEQKELEEVLADTEATLNNRPLTYIEEDILFAVLTARLLLLGRIPAIPNENPKDAENETKK